MELVDRFEGGGYVGVHFWWSLSESRVVASDDRLQPTKTTNQNCYQPKRPTKTATNQNCYQPKRPREVVDVGDFIEVFCSGRLSLVAVLWIQNRGR